MTPAKRGVPLEGGDKTLMQRRQAHHHEEKNKRLNDTSKRWWHRPRLGTVALVGRPEQILPLS